MKPVLKVSMREPRTRHSFVQMCSDIDAGTTSRPKHRKHPRVHYTKQERIQFRLDRSLRGASCQAPDDQIRFLVHIIDFITAKTTQPLITLWYQHNVDRKKFYRTLQGSAFSAIHATCPADVWDWYVYMTRCFPTLTFRQLKARVYNHHTNKFLVLSPFVKHLVTDQLRTRQTKTPAEIYQQYKHQLTPLQFQRILTRAKHWRQRHHIKKAMLSLSPPLNGSTQH